MSRPAAFLGDYVDCRFLPGLKLARISIEIPIEEANAFLSAFGAPDKASPVKVAIARLVDAPSGAQETKDGPGAGPQNVHGLPSDTVATNDRDKSRPPMTRSQLAYLKFNSAEFIRWFAENILPPDTVVNRTEGYEPHIKAYLGITSKSELDLDGPKAVAFDRLMTDFSVRGIVR